MLRQGASLLVCRGPSVSGPTTWSIMTVTAHGRSYGITSSEPRVATMYDYDEYTEAAMEHE